MKNINFYAKLEMLSSIFKEKNKLQPSKSRFDCTLSNGEYNGIKPFMNAKGMLFLDLRTQKDFVKIKKERMTEFSLVGKSMNFSGLYFEEIQNPNYGYGYPNGKPLLNSGAINPTFEYRNDLFLFIVNKEFTEIELLVIKDSKGFASDYLQLLCNGELDAQIEELRMNAKPFFDYGIYPLN
jgi:hypothetical protein